MKMDPLYIGHNVAADISFCNYAPGNASARPIDSFDFEFLHYPARGELGHIFHRVRMDGFVNSVSYGGHKVCCHDDKFFRFRITGMSNTEFLSDGFGLFKVKWELFTY